MALALHHFIRGTLITTPPFIYIFVGDIPMNSLVGDVASSASQESDMRSDDPNALPQGDSSVLSPNPVNPQENNALPPSDQVVDNGNAKESEPGVSTGDSVVSNGITQKSPIVSKDVSEDSNPGVVKEPSVDGHSSVDKKEDAVGDEPSGNGDRVEDGRDVGDDDDTDDEEQEPTEDPDKIKEFNEKLEKAGIDKTCFLPDLKTVGKCTLTKNQLERINFPQREEEEDSEFQITGLGEDEKVTITIESGYSEDDFPKGGLRITLNNPNSGEIKITGGGTDEEILKPNIDYDYKFSYSIDNWLDKAWNSLQRIGAKVGLNINDSVQDECTPGKEINKEINVWKSEKEYVIGGLADSSEECLMKHESDVKNLLEGFKLTVKDGEDISLKGGTGPSKGTIINTLKKDASYSFAPKRIKGEMVWFLIEENK